MSQATSPAGASAASVKKNVDPRLVRVGMEGE